jgi:hypothetical protein
MFSDGTYTLDMMETREVVCCLLKMGNAEPGEFTDGYKARRARIDRFPTMNRSDAFAMLAKDIRTVDDICRLYPRQVERLLAREIFCPRDGIIYTKDSTTYWDAVALTVYRPPPMNPNQVQIPRPMFILPSINTIDHAVARSGVKPTMRCVRWVKQWNGYGHDLALDPFPEDSSRRCYSAMVCLRDSKRVMAIRLNFNTTNGAWGFCRAIFDPNDVIQLEGRSRSLSGTMVYGLTTDDAEGRVKGAPADWCRKRERGTSYVENAREEKRSRSDSGSETDSSEY